MPVAKHGTKISKLRGYALIAENFGYIRQCSCVRISVTTYKIWKLYRVVQKTDTPV